MESIQTDLNLKTQESQRSFDAARHPLREAARKEYLETLMPDEIRSCLAHPKRILVIGGGDGIELAALKKYFPEALVCAIDLSKVEVFHAQAQTPITNLVLGDWDQAPFASGSFDLIFGFAALHHSEDLAITLTSLNHLLRPGGWLYCTHEPMASFGLGIWQKRHMEAAAELDGGIERSPTRREWRRAFRSDLWTTLDICPASINWIRLRNRAKFDDVELRRSAMPERLVAVCLRWWPMRCCSRGEFFVDLLQRIALGLFGVTIKAQKTG